MDTTETPVDIGKVIQNGVVFDLKNWVKTAMNSDAIPQTINRLFDLLKQRIVDKDANLG